MALEPTRRGDCLQQAFTHSGRVLGPRPSQANPGYTAWGSWSGLLAVAVWDRMPDMLCDDVMGSRTS